ncbi:IclR family transcriptional regulator [Ureibacillus thermosphaericus]|uniref:IclR family transcriptional regulator n=1 Tax=Ureibacillus thermosphaericus TaxID=51173 RepID=UPI000BBC3EC4|nr:IclR family transcriptional regulator [Ureibacillus thermosphaericus]
MSKTFEKAVKILSLFNYEKPVWTLDEMAQETNIPKPTLIRFLKSFTEVGFLRRPSHYVGSKLVLSDNYYLGYKLIELGVIASSSLEVKNIALPEMISLRDEFDVAVQLICMDQLDGLYLEKVESTNPALLYTKVGRRAPLYAGACSRIILAYQSNKLINEILLGNLVKFASGTLTTKNELLNAIESSKKLGYAYSLSELAEGTVSLAVPIFNAEGKVLYSISIAGIEANIPKSKIKEYLPRMWKAAAKISKELGYSASYPYGQ